jgi:aconitate hydratase
MSKTDPFGALATLDTASGAVSYYRLEALRGLAKVSQLPFSIRIVVENLLRRVDGVTVTEDAVAALMGWRPDAVSKGTIAFLPARVLVQDLTGIPVVADLAAIRSEVARQGGDPQRVNPDLMVDLVIDHSVQVDSFGGADSFRVNVDREYERNGERYAFLRWAQESFRNFRVVPPGAGIVHQVNLEFLATVVQTVTRDGITVAFPDTLVGTDSHTTMINGLGVLGWGVGGIEAEAAMLNQPIPLLAPEVVGFRMTEALGEGVTATDLVLTVTQMLRKHGVVSKFVEFCGPGLSNLSLPDRATIANMSPEYGATCGYFPVDTETLRYLRLTGRSDTQVDLVERYCRAQGLFREDSTPDPAFSSLLELDLSTVEASMAGPRRPHERVTLGQVRDSLREAFQEQFTPYQASKERMDWEGATASEKAPDGAVAVAVDPNAGDVAVAFNHHRETLRHGSVVIAAITSCTNTSNPSVMLAAGLVAKKAVELGLEVPPFVKTSLAPGSRAVVDYLQRAGLMGDLEKLGFYLVGFGCTTCIGNSGPLEEHVATAVDANGIVATAVLSGNRNFEGRIHPQVRAQYLASPPLVVAYALAGTVDIDLRTEPLGTDKHGEPVFLADIWPSSEEIKSTVERAVGSDIFKETYAHIFDGEERWKALKVPQGALYDWDPNSTYLREPPFVQGVTAKPAPPEDIKGARVLVMVGDSVTTDHISPAGSIAPDSPAAVYMEERGVSRREFNSYGSRRGNHEVMMRGTFANIRLKNEVAPDTEGGWTRHLPGGEQMSIYDAAMRYRQEGPQTGGRGPVPLLVIAGQEYGTGSSRDWAAKGSALLGVRAVIVESYERIHRSNLIGMGVLPLEFLPGECRISLGLTGDETYDIEGLTRGIKPHMTVTVRALAEDGSEKTFEAVVRVDSPLEAEQYRHGGILPMIVRRLVAAR